MITRLVVTTILTLMILVIPTVSTSAQFNGMGVDNTPVSTEKEQEQESKSKGDAIGGMFTEVSIDEEATKQATNFMTPLVKGANYLFAVLAGLIILGVVLFSIVDIAFITIPILRTLLTKIVSEDAIYSMKKEDREVYLKERDITIGGGSGWGYSGKIRGTGSEDGRTARTAAHRLKTGEDIREQGRPDFNYGGGGGYGYGLTKHGKRGKDETDNTSPLLKYIKYKTVTLVVLGMCLVILTTTTLTDIGMDIGLWATGKILGM